VLILWREFRLVDCHEGCIEPARDRTMAPSDLLRTAFLTSEELTEVAHSGRYVR
jgi:hypothetical protein